MKPENRKVVCAVQCLLIGLLPSLGCGKAGRLETATVSGTVTLDGKPLTTGAAIFTPEMGRAATGAVQADGSYTLGTYSPSDGAVLGRHRVAVMAREKLPASAGGGPPMPALGGKWLIPAFYGDSARSGLSFEVKSGGSNRYDIHLMSTAKPAGP